MRSIASLVLIRPSGNWARDVDSATVELRRTGPFGYTVRVLPTHPALASAAEMGLVANAG